MSSVDKTDGTTKVDATVQQSMKKSSYAVRLIIQEEDIRSASCQCPRGKELCSHMACVALHAYRNVSSTDKPCCWKKPSKSTGKKSLRVVHFEMF